MAYNIRIPYQPNETLYAVVRRIIDGVEGLVWNEAQSSWVTSSTLELANDEERITLTAGTGIEEGVYRGSTSSDLAGYTGKISVFIVDSDLQRVVAIDDADVVNGVAIEEAPNNESAALLFGSESNKAQTIPVIVIDPTTKAPAIGSVISTQVAAAASSPALASTTNAATYTGSKGIYLVSLTATETNTVDPLLVRVTTSDGVGDAVLVFGLRQIEEDWEDGGRLDTILDATAVGSTVTSSFATTDALIAAKPTASQVADQVWDEIAGGHVITDSFGDLANRLTVLASGGQGELTPTRATKLDNLDNVTTTALTATDVLTQANQAIVNNHLDHLLAANFNASSPPGDAGSLFNRLTENDGGDTRFNANALEEGPSAGGASASTIAAAVWDLSTSGHTTVGTFGAMAPDILAIVADTNELQTDWQDGGRLDAILDGTATGSVMTSSFTTQASAIAALPTAVTIADQVWDEISGGHFITDSFGDLVGRLTLLSHGGQGELGPGEATLIDNLANLTTTVVTTSDILTQCQQAIENNHLDHLLAVDYDPATKPGSATALLNELVESDGGVARFSANTLEQAAGASVSAIADAVWDEATAGHTAAGTFGEMAVDVGAIVDDTDELQTDWMDGGRLDSILDSRSAQADMTFVKTTLDTGGTINTMIGNISATPNTLSPVFVSDARTWVAPRDGDTAKNIVTLLQSDEATCAMCFRPILNEQTDIATAVGVTLHSGDPDLTFADVLVSQDHDNIHVTITGQQSGKKYTLKFACTTTDGDTISRLAILKVS